MDHTQGPGDRWVVMCHISEFVFFSVLGRYRDWQVLFITSYKMCAYEEQCVFSVHLSKVGVWVGGRNTLQQP